MGVVTVLWVLYGYSLAFGNDVGNLFGDPTQYFGLKGLIGGNAAAAVAADPAAGVEAADAVEHPAGRHASRRLVFVAFQLMFAIITVALISGAVADRLKFGGWLVFAGLWATFVYFPIAHWVFAFDGVTGETGGWIANKLKAIDFAGGTAVHINAGAAGLVLAIILGKRKGWPTHADAAAQPAVRDARRRSAVVRLVRVQRRFGDSAPAASPARRSSPRPSPPRPRCWPGCSRRRIRDGKATSLGAASGIVAGLVAITPSCSSVNVRRRAGDRLRRRCAVRPGRRPEVQTRLRRLARRGRRAPGRRPDRHPADRLWSPRRRRAAGVDGSVLRRRLRPAVAPGGRCRSRFSPTRAIVTTILALIVKFTIGLRLERGR